jgi:hypothetical protein
MQSKANSNSMNRKNIFILLMISLFSTYSFGQNTDTAKVVAEKPKSTEWYKKINLRGYAQLRYNKLFETNPDLQCEQCDKSWGGNGGFFFRRIRLTFSGQIHERVFMYLQTDFASAPASGVLHYAQIRDAYFDLGLDKNNEFRFRIGQSKVPFGFENLQSSSHRLPLDRDDALNSAVANERDLGIFFYWAPKNIRERFSYLTSSGLKGTGDYGVVGFGVYNGQTANKSEDNEEPHVVARVSYPFMVGEQYIEPGLQAYTGKFVVNPISSGVITNGSKSGYDDKRVAASLTVYPQPFGFMAEYNVGKGPEYNPETNTVELRDLTGGYMMASYYLPIDEQLLIPFVRYQYYEGGKKHERDARSYTVKEFEVGVEWQPMKAFEVVAQYTISDRRFEDGLNPDNKQDGSLLRLQLQFNY